MTLGVGPCSSITWNGAGATELADVLSDHMLSRKERARAWHGASRPVCLAAGTRGSAEVTAHLQWICVNVLQALKEDICVRHVTSCVALIFICRTQYFMTNPGLRGHHGRLPGQRALAGWCMGL